MGGCGARVRRGGSGRRKRGLWTTLTSELVRELERLLGAETAERLDFEAVETALRRTALEWTGRLLAAHLNADLGDYEGPHRPCPFCGESARYVDRRAKDFSTVLGVLRLERAYYCCAQCHEGHCPRDAGLGLESWSLSPGLLRMVGTVAPLASFDEGSGLLRDLAGVQVHPKQVERTAEALGDRVAEDERRQVEPERLEPDAPTLYLGLDGTGVPMRPAELLDRPGKASDGSAKTREVKLCVIWTAETRDAEGHPMRDPGSATYTAAIESAATPDAAAELSPFAQRVEREAQRRSFSQAQRQVVLGDGAPWIWNLTDEHFPQAIQIVDRFHAKEKLSTVAQQIYTAGSDLAAHWRRERLDELDAGNLDAILRALDLHTLSCDEARKAHGYFATNRQRMRYPLFHAQGLCTSTGIVEAGCRHVIGARLKRSGMRWTLRGANAIIALRCAQLSRNRFEDFWQRQAVA